MRRFVLILVLVVLGAGLTTAQDNPTPSGLTPLLLPASVQPSLRPPVAPSIYGGETFNQTSGLDGGGVGSQDFTDYGAAVHVADDFVVGAGGTSIGGVYVPGIYITDGSTPVDLDIIFYDNAAGVPGSPVCSYTVLTWLDTNGDFTIDLPTPCNLTAGTHWVTVAATMACATNPCNQWFWETHTQVGNPGVMIDPLDLYGLGCTTWTTFSACTGFAVNNGVGFILYDANVYNLSAGLQCDGDDLVIDLSSGDPPFTIDLTLNGGAVTYTDVGLGSLTINGPGDFLDIVVTETGSDPESVDFGDFHCPVPLNAPNNGMLLITVAQSQPIYDSAGGSMIRLPSGEALLLPHDYDGNGFDTHIITAKASVAGQIWYGIFIGNDVWVWLPNTNVTVLYDLLD